MPEVRSAWTFDRTAALDRLDDDEALLAEVIEQFLEYAPTALLAIDHATRVGDGRALRDAAHGLKGAAGYLAADDLCVAAQELEGFGLANHASAAREQWPAFNRLATDVVAGLRSALANSRR